MNDQTKALWEQRLGDGLTALAEIEAPVPTVTVPDVIASGRSLLRRRRGRTAFALSAVLIAGTALTFGALAVAGRDGTAPAPPAGDGRASAVASASIGVGSDPAAPTIAFGWLPKALNGEYEVEQDATGPNYNKAIDPKTGWPTIDGPGGSMVQVWAPGDVILSASVSGPGSGTQPGLKFTAVAGDVPGHKAWWTTGAPGSKNAAKVEDLVLMWQYEPNAWATVDYHGNTGPASGTMLLKVANGLVIGPTNPAPLPFQLKGLPAGMHADSVDIDQPRQHAAKVGAAALRLCVVSPCTGGGGLMVSQNSTTWQQNSSLTVDGAPQPYASPTFTTPLPDGTLNKSPSTPVTVNGHQAELWTNAHGATLVYSYAGASIVIEAADAEYKALGGESGFLAFCRSVTFLGTNPANWTTDVIR